MVVGKIKRGVCEHCSELSLEPRSLPHLLTIVSNGGVPTAYVALASSSLRKVFRFPSAPLHQSKPLWSALITLLRLLYNTYDGL